ncbi:myo-inositol transporter [Tulasnella sp. 418]|nr:myo-inositol transporter [Tulasnella sp. 418]
MLFVTSTFASFSEPTRQPRKVRWDPPEDDYYTQVTCQYLRADYRQGYAYIPLSEPQMTIQDNDEIESSNHGTASTEEIGHTTQSPSDLLDETVKVEHDDHTTLFVWILVFASSISGLLFGYDTGVISGALVTIRGDLGPAELSNTQKELITSATTLGALLGGFTAGILSDRIGRKWVLAVADLIFIAGAVGQSVCRTVPAMIGGRFVIGWGVGLASCVVPLLIGEVSPTKQRGRLVTVNVVSITLGQVIAYGIGAAFESVAGGWRWMVGLGAVPAGIQLLLLPMVPESPRILLRQGNRAAAFMCLKKIYPNTSNDEINSKVTLMEESIKESVAISKSTTLFQKSKIVFLVPSNRRALSE